LKERRNEKSDCSDEMKALSYDVGTKGGYFVSNVDEVVKMKNIETLGWLCSLFQYMDSTYGLLKRLYKIRKHIFTLLTSSIDQFLNLLIYHLSDHCISFRK